MAHLLVQVARRAGLIALFVVAAALGTATGLLFAFADDMPQVSALDDYAPSTITRVHASGGELIGEFATERRVVVGYDDLSPLLRQAIIAAEDQTFDSHSGLSIPRIIVTALKDLVTGQRAGASTLTQQLARNLFLTNEKTWERKIKEAILTIQIEKRYTKREILTLYCNHIPWGHGTYGAEAGARLYFGKSARDVTLVEAATLAGIIQAPARQSPYVSVERATRRRNYALQRMADEGFITQAQADEAKRQPVTTSGRAAPSRHAAFFVEEVRQHLEERYGAKRLYEGGLRVETSLDFDLQRAAERALDDGLRKLDKRRGFRPPEVNVVAGGGTVEAHGESRWERPMSQGDVVPAVVTGTDGTTVLLRVGPYAATLPRAGYAWTRRTTAASLVKTGDLVDVRLERIDEGARTVEVSLEQTPLVEGALVAIDNRSGQIRAMIGGYDFARSKFNRATQAFRQMGSTFKPVVYTAAIDRGYTPVTSIVDEPVAFEVGPNQPLYSPQNYDRTYKGPITLRYALEHSRNVPTVKLTEALTPQTVIEYARRFGFTNPIPPVLSIALGAAEASLIEATSAYAVFPNQGVRMRPYGVLRVRDREGNLLEENRPEAHDAIRADTAFVMTNLLRGVTLRGTAASAAALDWPLAGKTGTMDDYTDAWFIGFDPEITVGVWIGHDEKKPLGPNETGATAALPIWIEVMKARIELRGREPKPEFAPPGNIVFASIGGAVEAFIAGTQPAGTEMLQ